MKARKSEKTASPFLIRSFYLVVLVLSIPLLAWNGIVSQLDAGLTDVLSRLLAPAPSPAVEKIVLLAIDDGTLSRYGHCR